MDEKTEKNKKKEKGKKKKRQEKKKEIGGKESGKDTLPLP